MPTIMPGIQKPATTQSAKAPRQSPGVAKKRTMTLVSCRPMPSKLSGPLCWKANPLKIMGPEFCRVAELVLDAGPDGLTAKEEEKLEALEELSGLEESKRKDH